MTILSTGAAATTLGCRSILATHTTTTVAAAASPPLRHIHQSPLARQICLKRRRRVRYNHRPDSHHGSGTIDAREGRGRTMIPGTTLECLQGLLVNALIRAGSCKHYPEVRSSLLRPSWWTTYPASVPIRFYSTQSRNGAPEGPIAAPDKDVGKGKRWTISKWRPDTQRKPKTSGGNVRDQGGGKDVPNGVILKEFAAASGSRKKSDKANQKYKKNGGRGNKKTQSKGGESKVANLGDSGRKSDLTTSNKQSSSTARILQETVGNTVSGQSVDTTVRTPSLSSAIEAEVDRILHSSNPNNSISPPKFTITRNYTNHQQTASEPQFKNSQPPEKPRKESIRNIKSQITWETCAMRARMLRAQKMLASKQLENQAEWSGRVSPRELQQNLQKYMGGESGSGASSPIGTAALMVSKLLKQDTAVGAGASASAGDGLKEDLIDSLRVPRPDPQIEDNLHLRELEIEVVNRISKENKDLNKAKLRGLMQKFKGGGIRISTEGARELRQFMRRERAMERGRAMAKERLRPVLVRRPMNVLTMEDFESMGAWSHMGENKRKREAQTEKPEIKKKHQQQQLQQSTIEAEESKILKSALSQKETSKPKSRMQKLLEKYSTVDPSFLPWNKPTTADETQRLLSFLEELHNPSQRDTLDDLFVLYRSLPEPRLSYLRFPEINLLLSHFISVPIRTDPLMVRYLSIIDDMRNLRIPLTHAEWIVAISFVAQRFNNKIGIPEIEAALRLWAEAEDHAGVELGPTLYNILLDMASKGKQPELIAAVLEEMEKRGIKFDRFTHTTMLTWYGSLQQAEKVRETFAEIVRCGEVVDTVMFNALLTALVRCREFAVAQGVFRRMKASGMEYYEALKRRANEEGAVLAKLPPPVSPTTHPYTSRRLGKTLKYMALKHQKEAQMKKNKEEGGSPTTTTTTTTSEKQHLRNLNIPFPTTLAKTIYAGPNIVTYNIFLHRSCQHGDMSTVSHLLQEMQTFNIRLEPSIFISLARGFSGYGEGRNPGSRWTAARLEDVYQALIECVTRGGRMGKQGVGVGRKISTVLACEIIKAFAVTTNSRERTVEVFSDVQELYRKGYGHRKEMEGVVLRVLQAEIGRLLATQEGISGATGIAAGREK